MEMTLDVPFPTHRHAEIAYDALRVDPEPKRSGMNKTLQLSEGEAVLQVVFRCQEAKTLRVAVNTFLDLLMLVTKTMDQFDQ